MDYQVFIMANSIARMITQLKGNAVKLRAHPQRDYLYLVGTIVLQLIILSVSLCEICLIVDL